MPYKVGKKTGKGWQIMKNQSGKWHVIAHSATKTKASSSIRAREAGKHLKKW